MYQTVHVSQLVTEISPPMSTTFKGTEKLDDVAVKFTNIFIKTRETALPKQRIAELVKQLAVQEDLLVIVESHALVLRSIKRCLLWTAVADPRRQLLPMRTPAAKTRIPPRTTWTMDIHIAVRK